MAKDEYKYPGTERPITVVRKEDILKTIDDNIIDKELAVEIVEQLETDAAKVLVHNKWVGIPYCCTLRYSDVKAPFYFRPGYAEMIKEARRTLTKKEYIVFRKQTTDYEARRREHERYLRYIIAVNARKHVDAYHTWCLRRGVSIANIHMAGYSSTFRQVDTY